MCKCKIHEGGGDVLPTEVGHLSRTEQKEQVRLSCQVKVKQDMRIEIPEEIFGIKKWEATVVRNYNVASFIKEFVVELPEEMDARRTIGIAPTEVLIIPRILACTFMRLLLGFYASVVAVVGGAVVGQLALGIPFFTFLIRIQEVVPIHDVWVGMIKAPVFGLIIAMAGCYHGMRVEGNSEEVGKRTTMAVVSAIFAVIVLDAFFAVFFTEIGWG